WPRAAHRRGLLPAAHRFLGRRRSNVVHRRMKIDNVEVIAANYRTDEKPPRVRSFALVKVTTSEGLVGWGEACDNFGHSTPLTLKAFFDEKLRWVLIGQDPRRLEALMWKV